MYKNISILLLASGLAFFMGNVDLSAPKEEVRLVGFVPNTNNKIFAAVMADGIVRICDVEKNTVLREICEPGLQAAALTAIGRMDNPTPRCQVTEILPTEVWNMILDCLTPEDRLSFRLVCSDLQQAHDITQQCLPHRFFDLDNGHGYAVSATSIAFAADSKTFVAGGIERFVTIWRWSEQRSTWLCAERIQCDEAATICSIAFSPDGQTIAAGTRHGLLHIFTCDLASREWSCRQTFEDSDEGYVCKAAFSPTGDVLVFCCSENMKILRFSGASRRWECEHSIQYRCGSLYTPGFSPDSKCMFIYTRHPSRVSLRMFNYENIAGQSVLTEVVPLIAPSPHGLLCMQFTSCGLLAVSRSPNVGSYIVRHYNVEQGNSWKQKFEFQGVVDAPLGDG